MSILEEEKKKYKFTDDEAGFLDAVIGLNYNPIIDASNRKRNLGVLTGLLENQDFTKQNPELSTELYSNIYNPLLNQENISQKGAGERFSQSAISSVLSAPGDVIDIGVNTANFLSPQNIGNIALTGVEGVRDAYDYLKYDKNFRPRPYREDFDRFDAPKKIDVSGLTKDFLFKQFNYGTGSDPRNIGTDDFASRYGKNFGDFTKFSLGGSAILSKFGRGSKYFDDMYKSMVANPGPWMTGNIIGDNTASYVLTYAQDNDWGEIPTLGAVIAASSIGILPQLVQNAGVKGWNNVIQNQGTLGKLKKPLESIVAFKDNVSARFSSNPNAVQNLLAGKIHRELSKDPDANIDVIIQRFVDEDIPVLSNMSDKELLQIINREGDIYGIPARIANDQSISSFTTWAAKNDTNFANLITKKLEAQANNLPKISDDAVDPSAFSQQVNELFVNQSKKYGDEFIKYLDDYEQTLIREFNFTPQEANKEIARVIRESYTLTKVAERNAWSKLESREFSKIILPDNFFEGFKREYARLGEQMQIANTPVLPPRIQREVDSIFKKIEAGEKITFGELYSFRSQLKKAQDSINSGPLSANADIGYNLANLEKSLLENTEQIVTSQGKEFVEALRGAKYHTFNKYETYERNPIINQVMQKNTARGNYSLNDRYTAKTILDFQPTYLQEDISLIRNILQSSEARVGEIYLEGGAGKVLNEQQLVPNKITIEGENAFQSILGNLANTIVKQDGKIDITAFYRWLKENKNTVDSFPRLKAITEEYKGNFKQFEKDLDSNIFGLKVKGRDPVTNKIIFETDNNNLFASILKSDNPVPIVQNAIFDSQNGAQKIIKVTELLKGNKALNQSFNDTIFASLIDDAMNSANPMIQLGTRLNAKIGDKTLKEVLKEQKILTESQLNHFEKTASNFLSDVDFAKFRLKEADTTTAMEMSEMLSAVFRAQGSQAFQKLMSASTGASGSNLVIAGRGASLGQRLFMGLGNNADINKLISQVMTDPRKTQYILRLVKDIQEKKFGVLQAWKNYNQVFRGITRTANIQANQVPEWFKEAYNNGD